jgi:hypothetical protein
LWLKYRSDYQIDTILDGTVSEEIMQRAKEGKFDERLALLGLILDAIIDEIKGVNQVEQTQEKLLEILKKIRLELARPDANTVHLLENQIAEINKKIVKGKLSATLSLEEEKICYGVIAVLEEMKNEHAEGMNGSTVFKQLKDHFDKRTKSLRNQAGKVKERLSNMFKFCEEVFGDGQEMLILVTELTISYYGAHFICHYGCEEYFAHNKDLLFYERQREIIVELEQLDLDD